MKPLKLSLSFFQPELNLQSGFFFKSFCATDLRADWKTKRRQELKMTVGTGSWYMSCWREIKKHDSALSTTSFKNCFIHHEYKEENDGNRLKTVDASL